MKHKDSAAKMAAFPVSRESYQQPPAQSAKKAEGKKRKSPCTPYREKGKGKEIKPGIFGTGLSACTHARDAFRRQGVNAAVEKALAAFCGTRGPAPSDEALWANFAWRFGYGKLLELVRQGVSEMSVPGRHVAPADRPRVLQNLLNDVWHARFPKTDAGREGTPKARKKASAHAAARLRTESREARQSVSGASLPCIGVGETRGGAA